MKTTTRLAATGAALLTLGLAACSGSDTATTTTTSSATSKASTVTSASPTAAASTSGQASTSPAAKASGKASAKADAPVPVTTPVPAPGGGSVTETVAPATVTTPSAKPIGATQTPAAGVAVTIATAPAKLVAKVPGDVSGAGVLVTVTLKNSTGKAVPAGDTVVNLYDASGAPAPDFVGEPTSPIHGDLAAGATAKGSYAFRLAQAGPVRIEVRGNPAMGIAVYEGAVKA